ncbi:MAG: VOC family protein [Anaerolineae bacterium]
MVRKARGKALYAGIEHVGIYPTASASGDEIVAWYRTLFGFKVKEGNSSFFISSDGPGRMEVMKGEVGRQAHIAVLVSDFEAAVEDLQAKGVELLEPTIKPGTKAVYLKNPDPAGNTVHLLWIG